MRSTQRVKPAALQTGDVVGIVAPASNIKRELLEAGCDALSRLGYKPFYLDSILSQDLYFAGSIDRRTRELEEMFRRNEVRAIICARGGYGANYLLPKINPAIVAAHPKIFVGYSDISTLLTWFSDATGLVTFHGPMVTKDFAIPNGVDAASWQSAIGGQPNWSIDSTSGASALVMGAARGVLYGGCLSMLVASLGTPYEIRPQGSILFIEDVAAKPYQIDRMLMQLKLSGAFENVRGIVFGEMLECMQHQDQQYTLQEIIVRIVEDLKIPVAYGLRSGHVSARNVTLPIGVMASLEVHSSGVTLEILEAATVASS